jgi:PmbA protein
MLSEKEAKEICDQILHRCGSDSAEIYLSAQDSALTRFANNLIHQNVAESNLNLHLQIFLGTRRGMASTNRSEEAALDEMVRRARANAQASPEDPDFPGLAEPTSYPQVDSFDQDTAETSPEQRAQQVGMVCRIANEKGLNASGAFSTGAKALAVANSQGVSAYHLSSEADFQAVVMDTEASGHAHSSGWKVTDIPVEELGREAIGKATRGRDPRKIEPGEYAVVLDPYVTQDLISMLNFQGMSARDVQDGRSWMNDRIGDQAMDPSVSIWDDGSDPRGLPSPFDVEGVPKKRTDIVSEGTVKGPVYDRYTANQDGVTSSGHAIPRGLILGGSKPLALNLFMAPGPASLEEMIRSTEQGLYITRFWYTRLVHPRDCIVTGMTRDGVFLIEDGELAYPVKNLRFTQSYVHALQDVEMIGRETRLLIGAYGGTALRVPALKISRFNFTGVTV